jgi:hypothetical protein
MARSLRLRIAKIHSPLYALLFTEKLPDGERLQM